MIACIPVVTAEAHGDICDGDSVVVVGEGGQVHTEATVSVIGASVLTLVETVHLGLTAMATNKLGHVLSSVFIQSGKVKLKSSSQFTTNLICSNFIEAQQSFSLPQVSRLSSGLAKSLQNGVSGISSASPSPTLRYPQL